MAQHKELAKLARATGAPVTAVVVEIAPGEIHLVPTLLRRVAKAMEASGCASLARQMLSEAEGRQTPAAALKLIGRYARLQGLSEGQLCATLSQIAKRRAQQMVAPVVEAPLYQRITKGSRNAHEKAMAGGELSLEEKLAGLYYMRSTQRHTLREYLNATAPHPLPMVEATLAWFAGPTSSIFSAMAALRSDEPWPPHLIELALDKAPEAVLASPGTPKAALVSALKIRPQEIWAVPPERLDEELVETALRAEPSANPRSNSLLYGDCRLKTPHLDAVAVQVNPENLHYVSAQTRALVLSAVSRKGTLLEIAEFVDEEIVDAACAESGLALEDYHEVLTARQRLLALQSDAVILKKRSDLFPNLTEEEKALAIKSCPNLFLPKFGVDSVGALRELLRGVCAGQINFITFGDPGQKSLAPWVTGEMLAVVAQSMLSAERKHRGQQPVDYSRVLSSLVPILAKQSPQFLEEAAATCGELLWVIPKSAPVEVFLAGILQDPSAIEAVPARWK